MKCLHLGETVIRSCCGKKETYNCERLSLPVVPAADCEDCRFFTQTEYTEMDYLEGMRTEFAKIKPDSFYETGGGDGILYVGGGKYWPGIAAGIRMLRDTGCTLPVEVWYRGECETVNPVDVSGLGVSLIDMDAMSRERGDNAIPRGNVKVGGWEAKTYALTHTKLTRLMYLDADAYCIENPQPLLNRLDFHPFIYWQDLPRQAGSIKWDHVFPLATRKVPPIQGGQLFIHRGTAWKTLQLAHYMCQNSPYYFRHMYGDQDAWRVAFEVQKAWQTGERAEQFHCLGSATWRHPVFICNYMGKPHVVHRCRAKLFLPEHIPLGKDSYSNPQYWVPKEQRLFDHFTEIVNRTPQDAHKTFTSIYRNRLWGGNHTGSGAGSTPKEGKPFIDFVNALILAKRWTRLVDVGCGDGYVGSQLQVPEYVGYDCYPDVLQRCKQKFPKNKYFALDIYQNYDRIMEGDILLCKDVLHHWPNEWVCNWLNGLLKSNRWKAILLCQDRNQLAPNQDCYLGGYRALSPTMEPLLKFPFKHIGNINHKAVLLYER